MESYEPRRRRSNRARERQMARKRRDKTPSILDHLPADSLKDRFAGLSVPGDLGWLRRASLITRDVVWYLVYRTPALKVVAGLIGVIALLYVASMVLGGRIFPNVWVSGIAVGDLTVEEAETALASAWTDAVRIELIADGEVVLSVKPADLGLSIDARATAEAARNVGLAGVPLGYSIDPVIDFDSVVAQNYLLEMTDEINQLPYEAGYEWRENELVGVPGRNGHRLDVLTTLQQLIQNPTLVATSRQLHVITEDVKPTVVDPSPYLDDAYALLSEPFVMKGYDPFRNEFIPWTTSKEVVASWLIASEYGLRIREDVFSSFVDAVNTTLNVGEKPRYLDHYESMEKVETAIINGDHQADLRIRYMPLTYTIQAGDRGYALGRANGLPFGLLIEANPGLDWDNISVGERVTLPSRDALLREDPVPNKRIVVDLDAQWLVAYENGEMVFSWPISSGVSTAPTYPGVFQILSHQEIAYGSGFSLCGEGGYSDCDQWQMKWFMGIYEVIPGLMNGFHGSVVLPGGRLLGDGYVGQPFTYGCVMSKDVEAQSLYEWAEIGTIVEIISSEFEPQSDLGWQAKQFIQDNAL